MKTQFNLSLNWKCQIIGWSMAGLYWGYIGYIGNTNEATDELILYFELLNGIFKNIIRPNFINNHEQS